MVFKKFRGWHVIVILAFLSLTLAFSFSGWADNNDELVRVKQAIKAKGAKWEAGETSISKLPPEQRLKRLGLKKPKGLEEEEAAAAMAEPPAGTGTTGATTAPASLDWRDFPGNDTLPGGDYVTAVRNQGSCGSCWAFATTAALEANVLITDKTPGQGNNFSEQTLVSCGGAGSCSGGYIGSASIYIRDYGLPVEACFPYTATNNTCANACSTYQTYTWAISSWHYVTTSSATVDAIKNALTQYGPLVTTMDVYSDFNYYKSGVYSVTPGATYRGGHAVLLVGYDDPGRYFIVKNSWGAGWGEAGYFRIAYSELASIVDFGDYTIAYVGDTPNPNPDPPTCTFTISPTSKTFKSRGGSGTVSVTTQSICAWTAVSDSPQWLHVTSGASGSGSGSVAYSVDPNSTTDTRTGKLTIKGQVFTVKQSGVSTRPSKGGGKGKKNTK